QPELGGRAVAVMANDVPLVDPAHRRAQVAIEVLPIIDLPRERGGAQVRERAATDKVRQLLGVGTERAEEGCQNDEYAHREDRSICAQDLVTGMIHLQRLFREGAAGSWGNDERGVASRHRGSSSGRRFPLNKTYVRQRDRRVI